MLIENRANVEPANKNCLQPLLVATYWSHMEATRLLIEKGAHVDAADDFG